MKYIDRERYISFWGAVPGVCLDIPGQARRYCTSYLDRYLDQAPLTWTGTWTDPHRARAQQPHAGGKFSGAQVPAGGHFSGVKLPASGKFSGAHINVPPA
jgi:hypothetical protein